MKLRLKPPLSGHLQTLSPKIGEWAVGKPFIEVNELLESLNLCGHSGGMLTAVVCPTRFRFAVDDRDVITKFKGTG